MQLSMSSPAIHGGEKKDLKKTGNNVMMRLSQDSARRPQEVQHLIHCCLAWNEYMPSVPIWPHAFLQFWTESAVVQV